MLQEIGEDSEVVDEVAAAKGIADLTPVLAGHDKIGVPQLGKVAGDPGEMDSAAIRNLRHRHRSTGKSQPTEDLQPDWIGKAAEQLRAEQLPQGPFLGC